MRKKGKKKNRFGVKRGGYSTLDLRHELLDFLDENKSVDIHEDAVWTMNRRGVVTSLKRFKDRVFMEQVERKFKR